MPDQHMTDYEQTELRSEGDILVRRRELEAIGLGMDSLPLQDVLWTDRAEVAPDDFVHSRVLACDLGLVESGAEEKTIFQDLSESHALLSDAFRRAASSSWISMFSFFPIG